MLLCWGSSSEGMFHQEMPLASPWYVKPGAESKYLQSNHNKETNQNKIGFWDSSGPKKGWNDILGHTNSHSSQVWQLPSILLTSMGQLLKLNLPCFLNKGYSSDIHKFIF